MLLDNHVSSCIQKQNIQKKVHLLCGKLATFTYEYKIGPQPISTSTEGTSVVDRHSFDVDQDPNLNFHFDTDPTLSFTHIWILAGS